MRILELAPYVFIDNHPYGKKNKSGLAYMIRSICDMLATKNEVHVLTQSLLTEAQEINGWKLIRRNWRTIICHFKFRFLKLFWQLRKQAQTIGATRLLLYCISGGQAEDYIKKWKPDVVHIHGIGLYTLPLYLAAARANACVVSTLHGLVSFNNIVPATEFTKTMEREFLSMCVKEHYSLTFISTGMKGKVQNSLSDECNNITVIPNCYRNVDYHKDSDKDNSVIRLICIGSVYPLKNQIQVIRILPAIREQMAQDSIVLDIYGDGEKLAEWRQYAAMNGIDGVYFHGRKPQKEVFHAISRSSLLVFPSIEEGFGIPIVEAYSCGTPVVTFNDLDASKDIANDNCCIFAIDRSDESLTNAICEALRRDWDNNIIKRFAHEFSIESVTQKYIQTLISSHRSWDVEEVEMLIKKII